MLDALSEWTRENVIIIVPVGFMIIMAIIFLLDVVWHILDDPKPKPMSTQPHPDRRKKR